MDAVIPNDMTTWDTELAPKIKSLSEKDKETLAAYVIRAKLGEAFGGSGIPPGTTVGDALKSQTSWAKEQQVKQAAETELKEKLAKKKEALLAELHDAVTVTLLDKKKLPANYDVGRFSEYQEFRIGVQNDADKDIIGVSGELQFIDVFDKEVGSVRFKVSEMLRPGESFVWQGGRRYNDFIDEHRAVWNLQEGKYTTRFVPETIVFKDGAKLTLDE